MKPIYKTLISKLLIIASEKFSNHGCNDLPDDFFNNFTKEEKQALQKDVGLWNGEPVSYLNDHMLMDFFADEIWAEGEREKDEGKR